MSCCINNSRFAVSISSDPSSSGDVVIGTKGLPEGRPTARILDHAHNLEPVDVRVEGNRLVLPKQGRDSASYLVTWER